MKNTWKWILGILGVVVLLAALVGAGYLLRQGAGYGFMPRGMSYDRAWDGPELRAPAGPMGRGFDRFHGPMMGGRGYGYPMPFGGAFFPFFGLVRLLPLALGIAAVVVAYQMGKRAGVNSVAPLSPAETKAPPSRKKSS